jgi:hydrogenase/urease accessory protein HupE
MHRASLILLLFAGEALAHPDHGSGGWLSATLSHLLSEPDHLAMILAPLVVGAAWLVLCKKIFRARTPKD